MTRAGADGGWREVILWQGMYSADAQERHNSLIRQSALGRLRAAEIRGGPGDWRIVVKLPLEASPR